MTCASFVGAGFALPQFVAFELTIDFLKKNTSLY